MNKKLSSILLIDDDPPTNFLHELLIKRAGVAEKVVAVKGGEEALYFLKRDVSEDFQPELIFVDIHMPEMDGWEFLKSYQKLQKQKGYKGNEVVIMLSTSLDPEDFNRALENKGVAGFKHKPLTEAGIREVIEQYFKDGISEDGKKNMDN